MKAVKTKPWYKVFCLETTLSHSYSLSVSLGCEYSCLSECVIHICATLCSLMMAYIFPKCLPHMNVFKSSVKPYNAQENEIGMQKSGICISSKPSFASQGGSFVLSLCYHGLSPCRHTDSYFLYIPPTGRTASTSSLFWICAAQFYLLPSDGSSCERDSHHSSLAIWLESSGAERPVEAAKIRDSSSLQPIDRHDDSDSLWIS